MMIIYLSNIFMTSHHQQEGLYSAYKKPYLLSILYM